MARGDEKVGKNPAKTFFKWKASKDGGYVYHWQKAAGEDEEGQNIQHKLPFTFMVLDELSIVGGFNRQPHNIGLWSNEVRNPAKDELIVRAGRTEVARGIWKTDIKAKVSGAKYGKSIYIAYKDSDTGELELGNLQLIGAASSAWITATQNLDAETGEWMITGFTDEINGDTEYRSPVFKHVPKVSDEAETRALELVKELKAYHKTYFELKNDAGADSGESGGYSNDGEKPDNPIANSLTDLVTAKQLGMIRAIARDLTIDADEECQKTLQCMTDELSIKAASYFIKHLQELQNAPKRPTTPEPDSFSPKKGDFDVPDDIIPF